MSASRTLSSALAAVLVSTAAASAALVEFTFETNVSTGTATVENIVGAGPNMAPILLYQSGAVQGAPGTGVTGGLADSPTALTDRAYDGSAAASTSVGGRAQSSNGNAVRDIQGIDGLRSFTVSAWVKADQVGGRLMGDDTFEILGPSASVAGGKINNFGSNSGDLSGAFYNDVNRWFFYAVTFDASLATNNVKYYKGYRNDAEAALGNSTGGLAGLTLVATKSHNAAGNPIGNLGDGTFALSIGNNNNNNRNLDGFIDNFRIEGSQTDSSGALSLDALESIRAADVVVPEPTTLGTLALAGFVVATRRRR